MFDAARVLGAAMRRVFDQDGASLKKSGLDFNATMIFGGQIGNEAMRLFLVYSAGNFIEATRETCFFQIGESKYGKPVLDRMIRPSTPLDEAAKCVLVSMDSTLKSNLSVGLPLDLVVYEANRLQSTQVVCIDDRNPYFQMIRNTWGEKLRDIFESLDDPQWDGAGAAQAPMCVVSDRYEPMRKISNPNEKIV
jgi:putative proteasome-type protease